MASEHAPQHLRWRLTLLVGALVACVGAACVLWLLWHVERSAAQAGVQEWRAIATSVAQSQARQFGRAVRLGIPLPELPGVPAHFEGVLQRQPVLAAMALELADGRVLHQVRHPQRLVALDEAAVRVPVNAVPPPGQPATVVATVVLELADGASLRPSLWRTGGGAWAVVLLVAGLAALATWWGPARRWQAQHGLLLQALQPQAAPGDVARVPVDVLADAGAAGPLAPALEALAQGDAQLARAQAAVHSYAQELLAMDFDASLQARIATIVQRVDAPGALPPPVASAPPSVHD